MKYSEYALLMAILWSDFIILLIYFLHRRLWFVRIFSVKTILILYIGCFFRLFINIEMSFAREVNLTEMNFIGSLVNLSIGEAKTPITKLLVMAWLFVSLLLLLHLFRRYIKSYRYYKRFTRNCYIEKILFDIVEPQHRGKLSVITSCEIISPCITGIGRSTICLPERMWEKKKLNTVLQHEYAHYKNHDLLIVLLVDVFTAMLWWNLPVYMLKSHISDILEFKVDESILKSAKFSDARFYCKILIEFAIKSKDRATRGFAVSVIESRINRILNPHPFKAHKTIFSAILIIVTFSTFFVSYLFILQPWYSAPSGSDEVNINSDMEIQPDNTVVVNGKTYMLLPNANEIINEME